MLIAELCENCNIELGDIDREEFGIDADRKVTDDPMYTTGYRECYYRTCPECDYIVEYWVDDNSDKVWELLSLTSCGDNSSLTHDEYNKSIFRTSKTIGNDILATIYTNELLIRYSPRAIMCNHSIAYLLKLSNDLLSVYFINCPKIGSRKLSRFLFWMCHVNIQVFINIFIWDRLKSQELIGSVE